MKNQSLVCISLVSFLLCFGGCRAQLPGEDRERELLREAGAPYSRPFESRDLPEVAADSPYVFLLERALRADPEIEAAYFEWQAAFARAIRAGVPPDPVLGLGWMLTEPATGFAENLLGLLVFPFGNTGKLEGAAKVAFEEAKAAHTKFEALEIVKRGNFRKLYASYDFAARRVEIRERDLELLRQWERNEIARLAAPGSTAGNALRARIEIGRAGDALAAARGDLRLAAANVNSAMSRAPFEPLDPPQPMGPLVLEASDAQLLELSSRLNPRILEISQLLRAREQGHALAEAEGDPEFALRYEREPAENKFMLEFTLPLRRDRVRAALDEANANIAKSRAERRQVVNEVMAETAHEIHEFREAVRKQRLFAETLAPAARSSYEILAKRFSAGAATFSEITEARRALLEIDIEVERARTEREMALGGLLACCGADVSDLPPKEGE